MTWRKKDGGEMLRSTIYSLLPIVLILIACVDICDATATVVDVYRLVQYDLNGSPFGSRLAGLNHHAHASLIDIGADLSRNVILMPVRELNVTLLRDYIVNKKPLGGLLLMLPRKSSEKTDHNGMIRRTLMELERLLIHSTISYPVYFTFEDDKIDDVLADIRRNDITGQPASATSGGYKLVVSTPQPRKIVSPTITNIQGWLPGFKGDGDSSQLPTIAIVASYDTFGAAPTLPVGADSNGNGIVVLLEIARLFSRLYSNPKNRGRYNLLFGLTSGGPYNYNGTMKWLKSFDQRLRESIDHAICLNSIGSFSDDLWIHVSKPPENSYIKQVFEGISDVAHDLGVTIGIKHKKINISDPRVSWEHEQFSRARVTAITLSDLSSAPEFLESTGGLYNLRSSVDETSVIRSVKLVAESLARHIYGQQGNKIQIFADNSSLAVNPSYIKLWLDLLSRTPRVAPYLSKTDSLLSALKKELSEHTVDVSVQHDVLEGMFSFYDSTTAKLHIYQVASVTFDLILLLVLGSYLIILFSFLVITTRGIDDLISIFRLPPSSRKVKSI